LDHSPRSIMVVVGPTGAGRARHGSATASDIATEGMRSSRHGSAVVGIVVASIGVVVVMIA